MIAIIRISAGMPTSGLPPFFTDKFEMVRACNESLLRAGECRKIFMLDRCPKEWTKYFEQFGTVFEGSWGKKESLWEAYRVGALQTENILFLEDDYLWRPNTLKDLDLATEHFGLTSPYDHPDNYSNDKEVAEVYRFNNQVWRWCPTNTHTFCVRHEIFNENIDAFYYGLHDWQMYFKLRMGGIKQFTPIYAMATHLVENKLALNTNWQDIANYYKLLKNDEHSSSDTDDRES